MKKILSMLLVIVMLCGMCVTTVNAEENITDDKIFVGDSWEIKGFSDLKRYENVENVENNYWSVKNAISEQIDLSKYDSYNRYKNRINVTLNGEEIQFDQQPIIQNERTLVPMRAIFEAMECDVYWDGDSRKVDVYKNGNNVMTLWIDNSEMWTENGYITLDVPPQILNDRTLVPVRAISESMGAKVDWDENTRSVIIDLNENSLKKMVKLYQYDNKIFNNATFDKTISLNDTEYHITSIQTQKYDWEVDTTDKFVFTINDSKLELDAYFLVNDIYLCDLNPNDESVELIVSIISDNATNTINAFQYRNGSIRQLEIHDNNSMNDKNNLELVLGPNYHGIIMNKDNSITLTGKTRSHGMWGIRKTFRLDENNRITQDIKNMYEIDIDEFMTRPYLTFEDLICNHYIDSEAEYDMYLNNYALCKRDYGCLKKGDYFTIVNDDDNGNVFVRTVDGKEGWIKIKSLSVLERESISKLMFYMAG